MRVPLLFGLIAALTISLICLGSGRLQAQSTSTCEILLPLPNQIITGTTLPLALSFRTPEDAMVIRYDAYIGNKWLVGGAVNNPVPVGSFRVPRDADLSGLKLEPGTHTLYIHLTTLKGNVIKREQPFTYKPLVTPVNDHASPAVRIANPRPGEKITGPTTIKVEATDGTGIKWVMIYINDKLRAMMNEQPYEIPWNPLDDELGNGAYTLRARALDLFDNEGLSAPITVQVLQPFAGGNTPIESDVANVNVYSPGLFQLTTGLSPTDVQSYNRLPSANAVPSLLGTYSASLPALSAAPRGYLAATATGELLAVLPAKSLPSLHNAAMMPTLSPFASTVAPALAAPLASFARQPFGGGMVIPTRGALFVPAEAIANDRHEAITDAPKVPAMDAGLLKRDPAVLLGAVPQGAISPAHTKNTTMPADVSLGRAATDAPATPAGDRQVSLPESMMEQVLAGARTLVAMLPTVSAQSLPEKHVPVIPAEETHASVRTATSVMPRTGTTPLAPAGVDTTQVVSVAGVAGTLAPTHVAVSRENAVVETPGQTAVETVTPKVSPRHTATDSMGVSPSVGMQTTVQPTMPTGTVRLADDPSGVQRTVAAVSTPALTGPQSRTAMTEAPQVSPSVSPNKIAPQSAPELPIMLGSRIAYAVATQSPAVTSTPRMAVDSAVEVLVPFTVQTPETVTTIARALSTTPEVLVKLNPSLTPTAALAPGAQIVVPKTSARMYLDNQPISGGPDPFILDGYSMMPFRTLLEAKGGVVVWLPETHEVNAWAQNTFIGLQIGKQEARINTESYLMPKPAVLSESRTMVPLRLLMTALNFEVKYNPANGTYYLTSSTSP